MLSFWRKKKDHQAMQDAPRELVDNLPEPASTPPKSELAEKSSLINPAARGAAIDIGGVVVPLDLSYRHERDYFARHFLGAPHPLADLDRLIFHRFVRQGDVVLDAGANIGVTIAELLEAGAAHVHAFEAVPSLYRRIAAISDPRFTGYACALGDGEGTIPIWVSQTHNQGSTIDLRMVEQFAPIFGEKPVSEDVPLKRLDDACQGIRFDFMKVDVEGAEAAFLRGAANNLSVNPPRAMSMELYDRFFDEAKKEADKYFSKCSRCFLLKSDYSLHLADWSESHDDDRYYLTAPTYVFTN